MKRLNPADPAIEDLEPGLEIDENALERANAVQADVYYRVAKRVALEVSKRDAAAQVVEEAEARADTQVRRDMEIQDEKVTEGKVKAAVTLNKEVRTAKAELLAIKERLGQWQALEKAFDKRGYALTNLTTLYAANYFNTSTGDKSNARMRDAKYHEGREQIRRRLERDK